MTGEAKREGFTLWMTGLPGSGKSTLAGVLKTKLEKERGMLVEILDGVAANDTVILTGKLTLNDGQPVTVMEGK